MTPRHTQNGVFCATLTPFVSETGAVDLPWIPPHLHMLAEHIHGILVLGTTGEGPSLGLDERKRVLDVVLAHRHDMAVFVGTGCPSLTETLALSLYALMRDADAVVVMPPYYFKTPPDRGVLGYYRALCDGLPQDARLLLYHIPQVTGVSITPAVIDGLLESHGHQFVGIKDSGGDIRYTRTLIESYPQLHIYCGSDTQAAAALAAGATGVISACANVWPERVRAVYDAYQQGGDTAAAQARLATVRGILTGSNLPPALKAVLPWVSDLPRTSVRAPLANLSGDEVALLRQAFESIPTENEKQTREHSR